MPERRDATRRADTKKRVFSSSARSWVKEAQRADSWSPDLVEILRWTRRNAVVREVYFLEQALAAQKSNNITKAECLVKRCTTKTAAKTGLCARHKREAKFL